MSRVYKLECACEAGDPKPGHYLKSCPKHYSEEREVFERWERERKESDAAREVQG